MFYSSPQLPDWPKQRQTSRTRELIPARLVVHEKPPLCFAIANVHGQNQIFLDKCNVELFQMSHDNFILVLQIE